MASNDVVRIPIEVDVDEAKRDVEEAQKAIDNVGKSAEETADKVEEITEELEKIPEKVNDVAQEMDNVSKSVDNTKKDLDNFTKSVDEIGRTAERTAEKVEEITEELSEVPEEASKASKEMNEVARSVEETQNRMERVAKIKGLIDVFKQIHQVAVQVATVIDGMLHSVERRVMSIRAGNMASDPGSAARKEIEDISRSYDRKKASLEYGREISSARGTLSASDERAINQEIIQTEIERQKAILKAAEEGRDAGLRKMNAASKTGSDLMDSLGDEKGSELFLGLIQGKFNPELRYTDRYEKIAPDIETTKQAYEQAAKVVSEYTKTQEDAKEEILRLQRQSEIARIAEEKRLQDEAAALTDQSLSRSTKTGRTADDIRAKALERIAAISVGAPSAVSGLASVGGIMGGAFANNAANMQARRDAEAQTIRKEMLVELSRINERLEE